MGCNNLTKYTPNMLVKSLVDFSGWCRGLAELVNKAKICKTLETLNLNRCKKSECIGVSVKIFTLIYHFSPFRLPITKEENVSKKSEQKKGASKYYASHWEGQK